MTLCLTLPLSSPCTIWHKCLLSAHGVKHLTVFLHTELHMSCGACYNAVLANTWHDSVLYQQQYKIWHVCCIAGLLLMPTMEPAVPR